MRTDIARWLTGILGAWLVSCGLTFAAPASTDVSAPSSATGRAHHALQLALSAPPPKAYDGGDHESVLDEQDPPEAEAPTLSGVENMQAPAPVADVRYRRVALPTPRAPLDSPLLVEPRFLRYSRLLN
jgi:hypothetical protein